MNWWLFWINSRYIPTWQDSLKARDGFFEWYVFSLWASENLGHLEGLWEESLHFTGSSHGQLVFFWQLVHTQDSNDILQGLVILSRNMYNECNKMLVGFSMPVLCLLTWKKNKLNVCLEWRLNLNVEKFIFKISWELLSIIESIAIVGVKAATWGNCSNFHKLTKSVHYFDFRFR